MPVVTEDESVLIGAANEQQQNQKLLGPIHMFLAELFPVIL